jgi:RNA polymerase sigma-70 factor (ECF subfamily)
LSINEHELRYRQWLSEHTGILYKVVRSFAEGEDEAEDLFQEILLQVWLSMPNFRNDSKPSTWLYRVAFNTALAWKRGEKKRRHRHSSLTVSDVSTPTVSAVDAQRNDQLVEQLYAAIRALPPAKRALVVLYLDGFTYREISEVVGISETNVGASLSRIKKDLATTIKEEKDDSAH